jgi:hypothetical protein
VRPVYRRLSAAVIIPVSLAVGWLATSAAATATAGQAAATASYSLTAGQEATSRQLVTAAQARYAPAPAALATTARPGASLSSIAAGACRLEGQAFWPELWWANRALVPNPDVLPAGTRLTLPPCRPATAAHIEAALAALPPPPPPPVISQAGGGGGASAQPAPAGGGGGGITPAGGYEACVIAAESGGNPSAVNPSSGAGGLYGFLPSTWASLGYPGLPENASPALQQQAFSRLYAQSGRSPWITDGC